MSNIDKKIRVLVVEDNLVVQQYLKAALQTDSTIEILDIIANGRVAVDKTVEEKPDIILLDLFLEGIDGIEVIQEVMSRAACPIVVISGELDRKDRDLTFEAQRAGAVSVMAKPIGMEAEQFDKFSKELCHNVKIMSQVKVTRRWLNNKKPTSPSEPASSLPAFQLDFDLLVIGSSTGGPAALYQLLESLGPVFPFPILIAQHIASGFSATLCGWLSRTGCKVSIPEDGEIMQKGHVYLSNDDRHLVLGKNNQLFTIENNEVFFTPNVDLLCESVAANYNGKVCALILTGMGNDGTSGLARLYEKNAIIVAESESSCVVFGMPKSAINAGVVKVILSLNEICQVLSSLTQPKIQETSFL